MKEIPVVTLGIAVIICVSGPVSAVVVDSVVVNAFAVPMGAVIDAKMIAIDPGHVTRRRRAAGTSTAAGHSQRSSGTTAEAAHSTRPSAAHITARGTRGFGSGAGAGDRRAKNRSTADAAA